MTRRKSPFTGWEVLDGLSVISIIPYSASFEINGVRYMATTDAEAERLGNMIVKAADEAETAFLKSHPELNP